MTISPSLAGWAPESTRICVDLPAPLPPTRATTSPAWRSTLTPSTACTPPNETRMSRISTSGGGRPAPVSGTIVVGSLTLVIGAPSPRAAPGPRVEAHGDDEHDPDVDVLGRRVDLEQHHARTQRLHDHRAEHGAGDGADAAGERRATDDGRRDHVELVAHAESGDGGVEAGRLDGGAHCAEHPHQHERGRYGPAYVDAAQ